jgi:hypothetical protein
LAPAEDANPFYPIPPFINTNKDFAGISIPYQPTLLNNTLVFALLLTKTEASGSRTVFFNPNDIPDSRIRFLNHITNSIGEP